MEETMFTSLNQILTTKFRLDAHLLVPDATLRDLDLDSLDVVELTLTIEKELGVKVTDDELLQLQSLAGIAGLLEQRGATTVRTR
jgi:acyl carrier protein